MQLLGGSAAYLRLDYQITTAQHAQLAFQDSRNAFFDTTIPGGRSVRPRTLGITGTYHF